MEGRVGNVKAEVDNVQIEMLFKILNKRCALCVNQSGQMPELGRPALCRHVLAQPALVLAEDSLLTLVALSATDRTQT